jgi:hypothetical protein
MKSMSVLLDRALDPERRKVCEANEAAMNAHLPEPLRRALAPFAPPPAHSFKRLHGGEGPDATLTPTCTTCNWRGTAVPGWKSFQMTEVEGQETQHRMSDLTPQQLRDGACL